MKPCPGYAYLDSPLVGTENGFTWKQVSSAMITLNIPISLQGKFC